MNNELKHYGVPGMKWGVRKDRSSGSSKTTGNKTKRITKEKIKEKTKKQCKKAVRKGAEMTVKLANTALMDQVVTGGAGRKVVKEAVKQTGRAAVTAYTMAKGGYDIRWYDN